VTELDGAPDGLSVPGPPVVVTRSEEEMVVTTEWRASRRVRVVKRIVSESRTIQVRREELFVEELPVADREAVVAPGGPLEPVEFVLHEEQVVVTRLVVPVERIRVSVEVTEGLVDVAGKLRRERIDVTNTAATRQEQ
jgi:uncharacterized protein (TIGR02271 family)